MRRYALSCCQCGTTALIIGASVVLARFTGSRIYVNVVSDTTMSLLDAFRLDDQVNRELTIDGVNSAHKSRDFVYPNLVSTS